MITPPRQGYKRAWVQCKECAKVMYYDYVPYALSNPIMTTSCGHSFGHRDLNCKDITKDEALRILGGEDVDLERKAS